MADLLIRLEATEGLGQDRRRDLRSAIRRICAIANRDPALFPADVTSVRLVLRKIHPAQLGLSPKTLQNLKPGVLAALRLVRTDGPTTGSKRPLRPEWRALRDRLPSKQFRDGMARFMRYCSEQGIVPTGVNDAAAAGFVINLREQTFVANPNELHRRCCRLWNQAIETVSGWPQVPVTVPSYRKPRESFRLEEFSQSFQKDAMAHLKWLRGTDLFCKNPPPRACKPSTILLRCKHIELAASALVQQGYAVEQLQTLSDLVAVDAVKTVLQRYLDRQNHEPSQFLRDLAKTLNLIARYWVQVDSEHLDQLRGFKRRLGSDRTGLTEKNRAILRQFDSLRNVALLLTLPQKLVDRSSRLLVKNPRRAAVVAQTATAIEILLMAPMRMHNLIDLRLDQHVLRPDGNRGSVHLHVPGTETKSGEIVEYPLPAETTALLDTYLRECRPHLCDERDPWLFPRTGGGRKSQATLSQQVRKAILKHTGLEMSVHKFRHLAAKLLLDQQPGNFEGARQLLTHRNIKSTVNFYSGLRTPSAARHYDDLLLKKRRGAEKALAPK